MEEKIPIEPQAFFISNVNIDFGEDFIRLIIISGAMGRQYALTPAHAKRMALVLQNKITEFEKQFGVINTYDPSKGFPSPFQSTKDGNSPGEKSKS